MKQGIIYAHSCANDSIIIPKKEVLRYMGCKGEPPEVISLIDEFLPRVQASLSFKGSFGRFPVSVAEASVSLAGSVINSRSLGKNLSDCREAVVFALSAGTEADRLVSRYGRTRPSAALCINSVCTAAIESYASKFCSEVSLILQKEKLFTRPRFSPGYGDFSLEFQPFLLNLVNASGLCGITVTNSLFMLPSKSITAVMGISKTNSGCIQDGCEMCNNKSCKYKC